MDKDTFVRSVVDSVRAVVLPDVVGVEDLARVAAMSPDRAAEVLRAAGAIEVEGRMVIAREALLVALAPARDPDAPVSCAGSCGRRVRPSRAAGYDSSRGPWWCPTCAHRAEGERLGGGGE